MNAEPARELKRVYSRRFREAADYRKRVWQVLTRDFFQKWIPHGSTVLDLGCGYGEFINHIGAEQKYGMDLNPDSREQLERNVRFLEQDCSERWALDDGSLDIIFTSNFFEHLPDKGALGRTLDECFRCLKPGGRLIAMGPNIKCTEGRYWDFWDHHVALTDLSLAEALEVRGFRVEQRHERFLPYTMVGGPRYPLSFLRLYLRVTLLWRMKGEQFLLIANKPK